MTMHRYYCAEIVAGLGVLSGEESRHVASVMRARAGDRIELFDGRGRVAVASITEVNSRAVAVEIDDVGSPVEPPQPHLTLFVAVPKGPRQHVLVEKCTELGVSMIRPVVCTRSVVKPGASVTERWGRYAIEAGKQSRRDWIPEVQPPINFCGTVSADFVTGRRLIASPTPDAVPLAAAIDSPDSLAVWIGPEGGFATAEVDAAVAAGIEPVSLGDAILRIETAAIAVAAAVRLR